MGRLPIGLVEQPLSAPASPAPHRKGPGLLDEPPPEPLTPAARPSLANAAKRVSTAARAGRRGSMLNARGSMMRLATPVPVDGRPHYLQPTSSTLQRQDVSAAAKAAAERAGSSTWTAGKWVASLGLHDIIAAALCPADIDEQYEWVCKLDRADVVRLLTEARLEGLVEAVVGGMEGLSSQAAATGADLNAKFATEAKFEMKYGSLSLFYGGLESLIGPVRRPCPAGAPLCARRPTFARRVTAAPRDRRAA